MDKRVSADIETRKRGDAEKWEIEKKEVEARQKKREEERAAAERGEKPEAGEKEENKKEEENKPEIVLCRNTHIIDGKLSSAKTKQRCGTHLRGGSRCAKNALLSKE